MIAFGQRTMRRALALIVPLLVVLGATAHAGVPQAPIGLTADLVSTGTANAVQLYWSTDSNATGIDGFNVYEGFATAGAVTFQQIGSTSDTSRPASYFVTNFNGAGAYFFYVTSYNTDGESLGSDTVEVKYQAQSIRWLQTPRSPVEMALGGQFDWSFSAVASNGGTLEYALTTNASGGSIGSDGQFSFTPTATGTFDFSIVATLASDTSVMASFPLRIVVYDSAQGGGCATLQGSVRDESGTMITSGTVSIYIRQNGALQTIRTAEISSGHYSTTLPKGSFVLGIDGSTFYSEFYHDVYSSDAADTVFVDCGDTTMVDWVVERRSNSAYDSVSGRVTDAADGSALNGATVRFFGIAAGNINQTPSATVTTDANGAYGVQLPTDTMYVALASMTDYASQYFDGGGSSGSATRLRAPRSEVNFTLHHIWRSTVEGMVRDSAGNRMLDGRVIAYRILGTDSVVASASTYARGYYQFVGLQPGTYIFEAMPFDTLPGYASGYYVDGGVSASIWTSATQVTIAAGDSLRGIDFYLAPVNSTGGGATLRGRITSGGGRIEKDLEGHTLGAMPVEDATVFVLDNSTLRGTAVTDASGAFAVTGLDFATYTIVVDKPGMHTVTIETNVTPDDKGGVDIRMDPAGVSGVARPDRHVIAARVMPNPASAELTVAFPAESTSASVRLYSTTGREVFARQLTTTIGDAAIRLDVSSVPSGHYLIVIDSGTTRSVSSVNIAH